MDYVSLSIESISAIWNPAHADFYIKLLDHTLGKQPLKQDRQNLF